MMMNDDEDDDGDDGVAVRFTASNKNKQVFEVGKLVGLCIECLSENISSILESKI
jgi:hypothetical protein